MIVRYLPIYPFSCSLRLFSLRHLFACTLDMFALAVEAEEEDDGVKVQVTTAAGNEGDVVDKEREERMIAVGVRGGPAAPATSVAVVQSRLFDDVPSMLPMLPMLRARGLLL